MKASLHCPLGQGADTLIRFATPEYGVAPGQYADFATLRGDASDGLPGVAGVGEKTAASLLRKFGDLAAMRAGEPRVAIDLSPRHKHKKKARTERA